MDRRKCNSNKIIEKNYRKKGRKIIINFSPFFVILCSDYRIRIFFICQFTALRQTFDKLRLTIFGKLGRRFSTSSGGHSFFLLLFKEMECGVKFQQNRPNHTQRKRSRNQAKSTPCIHNKGLKNQQKNTYETHHHN